MEIGKDTNDGTDIASPFETLKCAVDGEGCNKELQGGEVVCLLVSIQEHQKADSLRALHLIFRMEKTDSS
jgi:hypothetical protein